MAAFAGTPTSSPRYTVQSAGPRGAVGAAERYEDFYYAHTAGAGTGAVNLVILPPGKLTISAAKSSLQLTALATGAELSLGLRATHVAAEDVDAILAATTGKPALSTAAGSNKDLTFTAVAYGAAGEAITVAYVDPSGNNQVLGIVVTGTDIVVNLATNGSGTITSTANLILAALNADVDASALITTALKTGSNGTGVVAAMGATPLIPAVLAATHLATLGASDVSVNSLVGAIVFATIAGGNIEDGDIIQGWIAYTPEGDV